MNDEEREFEALMKAHPPPGGRRPARSEAQDDEAFVKGVGPVRPLAQTKKAPHLAPKAPAPPPPRPLAPDQALAALQQRLTAAQDTLATRETAIRALEQRLAAAEVRAATVEAQRDQAQASLDDLQRRYDDVDHERRQLARERPEVRPRAVRTPADVLGALEIEPAAVLRLVAGHDARSFVAALSSGDALQQWLDAHVALTCERRECRPKPPMLHLPVDAARCEVCGGSDIARAWAALRETCAARGVTSLGVVGGSPAYHTQLQELARGTPGLRLRLVDGSGRHTARDAQAILACDAVVIWCSTELNHSVTAPYAHAGPKVHYIPVRGVARMLRETAARLLG